MENFNKLPPSLQQAMLEKRPALTPPDGIVSNFVDPPNHTVAGMVCISIITAISTLCFATRLYTRVFLLQKVRAEDVMGFIAIGFYAGVVWAGVSIGSVVGLWVHQWNVSAWDMSKVSYRLYINPIMYCFTMLFAKSAVLLEWTHIFVPNGVRNKFFWTCHVLIVVNILFYLAFIIVVHFYCNPREKIWNRWIDGTCLDRKRVDAPSAVFNLVMDVIILLLPQRVIWKLNMTGQRRLGVSIIFSIGLLYVSATAPFCLARINLPYSACACAAGRIQSTFTLNYQGDVTYAVTGAYLWGLSECSCVIMVLSVPAIPKLFTQSPFFTSMFSSIKSWVTSMRKSSRGTVTAGSGSWASKGAVKVSDMPISPYDRMEDGDSGHELAPTTARPVGNGADEARERHGHNSGIVRTVEWDTNEQYPAAPEQVYSHLATSHHPWTTKQGTH
ncbi:unnamed protein product [Clonostachys chloroleuca]|uniref:Rhodopsin domain-containing protein n=1 Tax=Clonostachys chloroleuca TaxID=1926264 RepID=A0AA35PVW7_9HYPO|nr:unnamed protein product [Clonostachys chloroleuca]